jgi:hypothetical protein
VNGLTAFLSGFVVDGDEVEVGEIVACLVVEG